MTPKYKLMPIRGGLKKYMITFVSFLIAAAVIIAVFSLVTGSRSSDWLSDNNGAARESMFPFVYVSAGSLYVMNDSLVISEIDDHADHAVHDATLARVYYTRNGDLYEYDIAKNTRMKLCGGVSSYYLFKERKSIVYTDENGGLYLYRYNKKDSVTLRAADQNGDLQERQNLFTGDAHVMYFDAADPASGTASLYAADLSGKTWCISENASLLRSAYFWENDRFVSYYEEDRLVVANIKGDVQFALENAQTVKQSVVSYAIMPCTATEGYSDARNIRYILSDIDASGSSGDLRYVRISGGKARCVTVDTGVNGIAGCSEDDELVVYTKESGDELYVYKTQKGGKPAFVTSCTKGSSLYFDAASLCLYVREPDLRMIRVEVGDKNAKPQTVAYNAGAAYSYPGKPFVVIHGADETVKSIVLRNGRVESYSVKEERLFGKYDNKYLMCRSLENGGFSLDYVSGESLTRISGDIARNIIFDKNIEHVIYLTDGEMYIWRDGVSTLLGEYPFGIEAVRVEASEM